MSTQSVRRLTDCDTRLADCLTRYSIAIRRIHEQLPGFPATTPGSGNVGGGSHTNTSIVERLADTPDRALDETEEP